MKRMTRTDDAGVGLERDVRVGLASFPYADRHCSVRDWGYSLNVGA